MTQLGSESSTATADGALIARLRTGDERAFEQMVRELGPRLYATALGILHKEEDARDAVQETFLSAIRSLSKFAGDSSLSTWLHRITINACLMKLRTRRRKPERSIEDLLPRYLDDGHRVLSDPVDRSTGSGAGAGMSADERSLALREAIEELPENYRIVLVLRDIQGLGTLEAATVLGMTENALKTRLHRARQALRELLVPRLGIDIESSDETPARRE
jgi:RNA polymerase sigma-70 factor (ECF subfamily)